LDELGQGSIDISFAIILNEDRILSFMAVVFIGVCVKEKLGYPMRDPFGEFPTDIDGKQGEIQGEDFRFGGPGTDVGMALLEMDVPMVGRNRFAFPLVREFLQVRGEGFLTGLGSCEKSHNDWIFQGFIERHV
jgi:hypothetical protein